VAGPPRTVALRLRKVNRERTGRAGVSAVRDTRRNRYIAAVFRADRGLMPASPIDLACPTEGCRGRLHGTLAGAFRRSDRLWAKYVACPACRREYLCEQNSDGTWRPAPE